MSTFPPLTARNANGHATASIYTADTHALVGVIVWPPHPQATEGQSKEDYAEAWLTADVEQKRLAQL
ncbi:MAG: hypothetical protein WC718_17780, partial [Phycisphaerales bacterium]